MKEYRPDDRVAPSRNYPHQAAAQARKRHQGTVLMVRGDQVRVQWDGLKTPEWLASSFIRPIPNYVEELAKDFYGRMNPLNHELLSMAECRDIARRHFESQNRSG